MAAGLRDLLALQGVIPVSLGETLTNGGFTVGNISGVWVDGSAPAGAGTAGAISWLKLCGVWVTGSAAGLVPIDGDGGPREWKVEMDSAGMDVGEFENYLAIVLTGIVGVINDRNR